MKRIDQVLSGAARFVFGLGVGFALTSALVIVSGPALDASDVRPVDVVELDPVVVAISPERFRSERQDADLVPPRFHPYGSGAQKV